MTYFIVYETTCLSNGKIYVGKHQTEDLDDGYLGSGTILRRAIKKHGAEFFFRRILAYFDNSEEMDSYERKIVTEDFVAREDTYNLLCGGTGGFGYINRTRSIDNPSEVKRREKKFVLLS